MNTILYYLFCLEMTNHVKLVFFLAPNFCTERMRVNVVFSTIGALNTFFFHLFAWPHTVQPQISEPQLFIYYLLLLHCIDIIIIIITRHLYNG